jgi:hypothetical protein
MTALPDRALDQLMDGLGDVLRLAGGLLAAGEQQAFEKVLRVLAELPERRRDQEAGKLSLTERELVMRDLNALVEALGLNPYRAGKPGDTPSPHEVMLACVHEAKRLRRGQSVVTPAPSTGISSGHH